MTLVIKKNNLWEGGGLSLRDTCLYPADFVHTSFQVSPVESLALALHCTIRSAYRLSWDTWQTNSPY